MKDEYKAVGSWGTLGLEIVLSVLFGFFGGRWLDAHAGTAPWLSVVGFLFGCGAAGKAIHRAWKEMAAVTRREEREHGNPAPLFDYGDAARDRPVDDEGGSPGAPPAPTSAGEQDDAQR
jgi:hypothetical protein